MNTQRIIHIILAIIGAAGTVLSVLQFIMAVSFGELGRVIFYLIIALFCVELLIYAIYKLIKQT